MKFDSVLIYEDKELQRKALSCIPDAIAEKVKEEYSAALSNTGDHDSEKPSFQVFHLLALLEWFKEDFFKWFDEAVCETCSEKLPLTTMRIDNEGLREEVYKCEKCAYEFVFKRFFDPSVLLCTRQGRCGEWANVFTLICRSVGWDARLVLDETDHAWTEVYSTDYRRWLHCDPCENVCDRPLIYEAGWGKKLNYIMAYSHEEVQDVTWRYSAKHAEVLQRRHLCTEKELLSTMLELREQRQRTLATERKNYLAQRLVEELVEMMVERKPDEADKQGRISGSLSWRKQRGETKEEAHVWKLTERDVKGSGKLSIKYSPANDHYRKTFNGSVLQGLKGWMNGVFSVNGVFLKIERDWKVAYLAREEGRETGQISWKVDLTKVKNTLQKLSLRFPATLYENGTVNTLLCGDNACVRVPCDQGLFETAAFNNSKIIQVKATLSGGKGDLAWQHAQLFRQRLADSAFPFSLTLHFD